MTARGIIERILREAHAVIKKKKDKFNATSVIMQLSDLSKNPTQFRSNRKY